MNRTLRNRISIRKVGTQVMVSMGLAMLCAVVALAQDPGAPQPQGQPSAAQQGPRTDGQIEMDVVHALDASAALKNDLITAATIQGEVTLSGTVSTDASKQLAESIAAHVDGVTKVHNNLQIGNPGPDGQSPQPAPGADEMPDPDQSPAQRQMANLPPPGPAPDANPQNQDPAAVNNPSASGLSAAAGLSAARRLSAASACAAAVPESAELAIPAVSASASGAPVPAGARPCDHTAGNVASGAHQRAGR